jgi:hypothetical protein
MTLEVQGLRDASGDGSLADRVLGWGRESDGKRQGMCLCTGLSHSSHKTTAIQS